MAFKISTGSRNAMLAALKTALDGGTITIYDDTAAEPASASAAVPGASVALVEITESGDGVTGLTFDAPALGLMTKAAAEAWLGTNIASGTASWYRFVSPTDGGAESTTDVRLQGSVGILLADLLVADASLIITEEQRIDYYAVGLPAAA